MLKMDTKANLYDNFWHMVAGPGKTLLFFVLLKLKTNLTFFFFSSVTVAQLFYNCVAFLTFLELTFFLIYKAGKSGLSGQFLEMNLFTRFVDLIDSLQ